MKTTSASHWKGVSVPHYGVLGTIFKIASTSENIRQNADFHILWLELSLKSFSRKANKMCRKSTESTEKSAEKIGI